MPQTEKSPTPGLILFADDGHRSVVRLGADGRAVDLIAVWRAAEELVRNWRAEGDLPQYVGDFKRLLPLAEALHGRIVG